MTLVAGRNAVEETGWKINKRRALPTPSLQRSRSSSPPIVLPFLRAAELVAQPSPAVQTFLSAWGTALGQDWRSLLSGTFQALPPSPWPQLVIITGELCVCEVQGALSP